MRAESRVVQVRPASPVSMESSRCALSVNSGDREPLAARRQLIHSHARSDHSRIGLSLGRRNDGFEFRVDRVTSAELGNVLLREPVPGQ